MDAFKKPYLPKGFLSKNGKPTQNALMMFFIYLKNLPQGWDIMKGENSYAVNKVKDFFGWEHPTGFGTMIHWGVHFSCSKSTTSDERYMAMSKAYHDAKGLVGKGYVLSDKKIIN